MGQIIANIEGYECGDHCRALSVLIILPIATAILVCCSSASPLAAQLPHLRIAETGLQEGMFLHHVPDKLVEMLQSLK